MERKRPAVRDAWERVKFAHFGAQCHFSPSCDAGISPAVLPKPTPECWREHTALAGRVAPGAQRRGRKVFFLTPTSGRMEGNRTNELSGLEDFNNKCP